jgi:serine/threonine protein kinase
MSKLFNSLNDIFIHVKKNKLGYGSTAEVFLISHRKNLKKLYAMKVLKKNSLLD